MDFVARASAHQNLYAPSGAVALGAPDRDMLDAHGLAVTQIEVDLQLSVSGTFKFTVPNTFDAARADFLTLRRAPALDLLTLGARVWISMGYGDRARRTLLMSGYITSVTTSFGEGGSPDLEVSGVDATYRLTLGTRERQFRDRSVHDAVARVAADNNFTAMVRGSPPSKVSLDANMQSDLDFLRKLAENFSTPEQKWEFYARPSRSGDLLHFCPRAMSSGPVGTLKWGVDLLSFKPEANLGKQVGQVEVLGWDQERKEKIVGEARREPAKPAERGRQPVSGGELQKRIFGREARLQLRYPVKSRQEADQRAAAELAQRAKDLVRGDGETFGFPELLPDTRVQIEGLGGRFSGTYYVEKTVHRFDASGLRTRFSIQETTS
ncbi:MAG: phage late control family protein [Alphaproteobacteria bacterium]|nr:phage late control family protein [Alphaproteobacteria bacterium]